MRNKFEIQILHDQNCCGGKVLNLSGFAFGFFSTLQFRISDLERKGDLP